MSRTVVVSHYYETRWVGLRCCVVISVNSVSSNWYWIALSGGGGHRGVTTPTDYGRLVVTELCGLRFCSDEFNCANNGRGVNWICSHCVLLAGPTSVRSSDHRSVRPPSPLPHGASLYRWISLVFDLRRNSPHKRIALHAEPNVADCVKLLNFMRIISFCYTVNSECYISVNRSILRNCC